jgi:hypothetical protein
VVATALFHVDSAEPSIFGDDAAKRPGDQDFEIAKKTQLALLKSNFVLTAAIRNPKVASLTILEGEDDPVSWLQENLEVEFPQNAEILSIRLRGTEGQANDLVQLVDAVADAYKKEVVSEMRQRRLTSRDLLARNLENLNGEIQKKFEIYLDIARESDRVESGSGQVMQDLDMKRLDRIEAELLRLENEVVEAQAKSDDGRLKPLELRIEELSKRQAELEKKVLVRREESAEISIRTQELEQLQRIAHEMAVKLERIDIDAEAPSRIRQVQKAVISRE